MSEASTLQLKATKTDVLFRMLDSFNQDSVHVTVTWNLTNIGYCIFIHNHLQSFTIIYNHLQSFTIIHNHSQSFKIIQNHSQSYQIILFPINLLVNSTKKCTLPALYTIVKFYPTILFTLENNSDFQEDSNQSQICKPWISLLSIAITFTNTGAVRDTKSLCTCIALLDNSFRRFANVTVKEDWNHCSGDRNEMSFKKIGNADQYDIVE